MRAVFYQVVLASLLVLLPACGIPAVPDFAQWAADSSGYEIEELPVHLSVRFYNRVAEMLAKEFPDKLVGGYTYGSWKNPPVRERNLRPNILLGYVGFNDLYVADATRRKDLQQWDEWAGLARNLWESLLGQCALEVVLLLLQLSPASALITIFENHSSIILRTISTLQSEEIPIFLAAAVIASLSSKTSFCTGPFPHLVQIYKRYLSLRG